MAYGMREVSGKMEKFGYWSVRDWFLSILSSFDGPFRVAPLAGKYYGTVVIDNHGTRIFSFWYSGTPSIREKLAFGDGFTEEAWAEYCCDSHYESEQSLCWANRAVRFLNQDGLDEDDDILEAIFKHARWEQESFAAVHDGGGPNKRALK